MSAHEIENHLPAIKQQIAHLGVNHQPSAVALRKWPRCVPFYASIGGPMVMLRSRRRLPARASEVSRRAVIISALCTTLIALAGLIPWRLVPKTFAAADTQPTAATQPAAITGRVLDADGKPAVGATVWAIGIVGPNSPVMTVSASVATDGTFSLNPPIVIPLRSNLPNPQAVVFPRGFYFAEMLGVGISQRVSMGVPNPAPLQLAPATELRLTLTNPDGTPAAGVRLYAMGLLAPPSAPSAQKVEESLAFPDDFRQRWTVTTDAVGACVIDGLPRSFKVGVDVDDDRYATLGTTSQAIQLSADPVTNAAVILTPASNITGTVVYAGGKPAPGINLILASDLRKTAVTDAAGSFQFKRLRPGTYTIYLDTNLADRLIHMNPPTFAPLNWVARPVQVVLSPGQSQQTEMTLMSGGVITGKIRDKTTSDGVPNVSVYCQPDSLQAMTDASGTYFLRVLPGAKTLRLLLGSRSEYLPLPNNGLMNITVADGETQTRDFDLARDTTPTSQGKVIDAAGNPVAGAMVYWTAPSPAQVDARGIQADVHGEFQLRALPGTILRARFRDQSTATPTNVDGSGQPVVLQISAGNTYRLLVNVTDDQGSPITGATVRLLDGVGGSIAPVTIVQSASDGIARFDRVPTDLSSRIWIQAAGFTHADRIPVTDSTPGQKQALTIVLKRAASSIAGLVVDETGVPVPNAIVALNQPSDHGRPSTTRTDAQGHFSFDVVDNTAGTLTVARAVATVDGGTRVYRENPVSAHAGQTDLKLVSPGIGP